MVWGWRVALPRCTGPGVGDSFLDAVETGRTCWEWVRWACHPHRGSCCLQGGATEAMLGLRGLRSHTSASSRDDRPAPACVPPVAGECPRAFEVLGWQAWHTASSACGPHSPAAPPHSWAGRCGQQDPPAPGLAQRPPGGEGRSTVQCGWLGLTPMCWVPGCAARAVLAWQRHPRPHVLCLVAGSEPSPLQGDHVVGRGSSA